MIWEVEFLPEADQDMDDLDGSARSDQKVYKEAAKRRKKYGL